ncbi:NUDIX domain-containing protein [Streptomyces platensis]|uniref:NUDIX domain-containing protein n=1 Tax=Streptomyces platensis TaxID=58346 RepID=UPI003798BBD4
MNRPHWRVSADRQPDLTTDRQPVVAVAVIVVAAPGLLLVTDPNRRGYIELPGSLTHHLEPPEAAAERVVRDKLGLTLPAGQLVGLDRVERPNKPLITHIFATGPLTRRQISTLRLHNTRHTVRVLSTVNALPLLPPRSRARADAGLTALTAGIVAHLGVGTAPSNRTSARPQRGKGSAPRTRWAGAYQQPTVLVTSSAVVTDRQGHLLIVREPTTDTWSLPSGSPDTAVGETPQEAAERYALRGLGQSATLDQLLAIEWGRPSHPAHVHCFYGGKAPAHLRIDGAPCPQSGPSERKFIPPAAAGAFLSPQETHRVHACLTARTREPKTADLHDHTRARLVRLPPAADRSPASGT